MKINFDPTNNPISPTVILASRNGKKLGELKKQALIIKDSFVNAAEITFDVYKYTDGKKTPLWDEIKDFKLIWHKESDTWFSISVETIETDCTKKTVYGTQLGPAELSNIKLFDIEINTEDDIAREDYQRPTVLFDAKHPQASLLHRIMEKAPHYSILHVDDAIADIQRTFSFDDISIYDAFLEIAKEIGCLFIFHSNSNQNGAIQRTISVYEEYGKDTTIFIESDELSEEIQFTADADSIKNCFKLEAGDDLMTATIRNCNPNGTDYIWHISDEFKNDMSKQLADKIDAYDEQYDYYQNDHIIQINNSLVNQFNNTVKEYVHYNKDLNEIALPIKGYPAFMNAYYCTVDFSVYLQSALMPNVSMSDTNAAEQAKLLTSASLSPVAVAKLDVLSSSTANNAVLAMAKTVVDPRYKVEIKESTLHATTWIGKFTVTNYSDETDSTDSAAITVNINDDYESYVKQKIEKALNKADIEDLSISGIFKKDFEEFCSELKKYCLNRLISFHDACQSCLDILIEQGIADSQNKTANNANLNDKLYQPYHQKLQAIESEMQKRESELNIILNLQNSLTKIKDQIQQNLDFQTYLGKELWLEFCAYRREDKYSNSNYISDGLDNASLFKRALEFIETAEKEIYKSSELQHSISVSLKNLLAMKKFQPLVNDFEVGNWLRVKVDDEIYKLRLLEYQIDFDNIENVSVEFSEVTKVKNTVTDVRELLNQAKSMTSSYSAVQQQASKGETSHALLKNWVENGLKASHTKIIGGADNQTQTWDSHGMLFRKYEPITDSYEDEQMKIVNSTIAITSDNWNTVKTAIGSFYYEDPADGKLKYSYGINAETIVGKLILGESLGIYCSGNHDSGNNALTFNENGLEVTNGSNKFTVNPNEKNGLLAISHNDEKIFYVDENGKLHIKGDGSGLDISGNSALNEIISKLRTVWDVDVTDFDLTGWGPPPNPDDPKDCFGKRYFDQETGNIYLFDPLNQIEGLWIKYGAAEALSGEFSTTFKQLYNKTSIEFKKDDIFNQISVEESGINMNSNQVTIVSDDVNIKGNLSVSGEISRAVKTENYGTIKMKAVETAEAYFSDIGSGKITDGTCYIYFDPVFAETIDLNADYQIFLTQTSKEKTEYVVKKNGYFIVYGETGATFDWMITAKQKD